MRDELSAAKLQATIVVALAAAMVAAAALIVRSEHGDARTLTVVVPLALILCLPRLLWHTGWRFVITTVVAIFAALLVIPLAFSFGYYIFAPSAALLGAAALDMRSANRAGRAKRV